jgi:hypothetical protein
LNYVCLNLKIEDEEEVGRTEIPPAAEIIREKKYIFKNLPLKLQLL